MFDPTATTISEEEVAYLWSQRSDEEIAADDDPGPAWAEPDPLDEIARLERVQSMLIGDQLVAMARHINQVMAEAPPWHRQDAFKSAYAEIALRLGLGASG